MPKHLFIFANILDKLFSTFPMFKQKLIRLAEGTNDTHLDAF